MMKRRRWHFRTELFLIRGIRELKEGQGTTVADLKEAVAIGADRPEQLVRFAPSGNQGETEQILIESSCGFEIAGDISIVMQSVWNITLFAHFRSPVKRLCMTKVAL